MARDILSEYGNDSGVNSHVDNLSGGEKSAKELPYSPPVGPKGQMHKGVGLGGTNMGNCGTQGKR